VPWVKNLWDDFRSHKHDRPLLVAIVGIGAVFRLYHLDAFGIWRDEAQTIFLARHSFPSGILQALMYADVSPPLYYFLLHFWERVFGSDWGLRFFSVVWGLVTIPLLYWVGRKVFDADVALLAALTAALSPHHIVMSRTVRMYTILPLASLLAMYFVHRFVAAPADIEHTRARRIAWLGIIFSFAFVLYTHSVGAFFILSVNCFFAWEMIWHKEARQLFWHWTMAQLCVALLYAPWMPVIFKQLHSQGAVMGPWLPRQSRLSNALRLFNELVGLAWPGGRPWLWIAICVLGTFTVKFRRTLVAFYLRFSTSLNLILFCFIGPILLAALATPRTIGTIPSYVTLVAFPAMCYLVARGVNAVRPRVLSLLLLLGLSIVWMQTVSVTYVRRTSNLREIASYVAGHIGSKDVIVIAPDYLASTFNYYYEGPQTQVAFPSTFGRVQEITWVGWADHWKNAAQSIEPTLQYLATELREGTRLWFIASPGGYPDDPYFSQIRVLKSRLDDIYGAPELVDSFPSAVESAEVYIYH